MNDSETNTRETFSRALRATAAGDRLFEQGEYAKALAQYQHAAELRAEDADVHVRLAACAWRAGRPELIEPHLLHALRLDPRHARGQDLIARWYKEQDRVAEALEHSAIAVALRPHDTEFMLTRALALEAAGEAQEAWKWAGAVLEDRLLAERAAALRARIAPRLKQEEPALACILGLLESPPLDPPGRRRTHFAAAALLDRMGRYDEAIAQVRAARQLIGLPFDPAAHTAAVSARIEYCTAARLRSLPHAGHGSHRPVFIVGMPRSGTSLVEQVLACHPQILGAGELPGIPQIAGALLGQGGSYAQSLDSLTQPMVDSLAGNYLADIAARNPTATCVTDKNPFNYAHMELIELLFPQCHVIHCMRDPLDTCLSCYMADFETPNGFQSELCYLGGYYRQYERLMAHWKQVLAIPIINVQYEQMVGGLEGQTRRLLDFLGLPWDERCLNFHQNKRPVATASRDQVRQPLYASSVGRWRNYEKHLVELIGALQR